MKNFVNHFGKSQCGATAVEYAILASLLGIIIIAALGSLQSKINSKYNVIGNAIAGTR